MARIMQYELAGGRVAVRSVVESARSILNSALPRMERGGCNPVQSLTAILGAVERFRAWRPQFEQTSTNQAPCDVSVGNRSASTDLLGQGQADSLRRGRCLRIVAAG